MKRQMLPKINHLTYRIRLALYTDETPRLPQHFERWCGLLDSIESFKDNHGPQQEPESTR